VITEGTIKGFDGFLNESLEPVVHFHDRTPSVVINFLSKALETHGEFQAARYLEEERPNKHPRGNYLDVECVIRRADTEVTERDDEGNPTKAEVVYREVRCSRLPLSITKTAISLGTGRTVDDRRQRVHYDPETSHRIPVTHDDDGSELEYLAYYDISRPWLDEVCNDTIVP
jgi:hypothetical protein